MKSNLSTKSFLSKSNFSTKRRILNCTYRLLRCNNNNLTNLVKRSMMNLRMIVRIKVTSKMKRTMFQAKARKNQIKKTKASDLTCQNILLNQSRAARRTHNGVCLYLHFLMLTILTFKFRWRLTLISSLLSNRGQSCF